MFLAGALAEKTLRLRKLIHPSHVGLSGLRAADVFIRAPEELKMSKEWTVSDVGQLAVGLKLLNTPAELAANLGREEEDVTAKCRS